MSYRPHNGLDGEQIRQLRGAGGAGGSWLQERDSGIDKRGLGPLHTQAVKHMLN
jgi:hypothetical protein